MKMHSFLIGAAGVAMACSTATMAAPVEERASGDADARWHDCGYDFNADGIADYFDVIDFVTALFAGDAAADINADGIVDWMDVWAFIELYQEGCDG